MLSRLAVAVLVLLGGVFLATHVLAPLVLTHYEYAPELAAVPKLTTDARGRTGDPINIAVVASSGELRAAMRAAGWEVADSLTRASGIAIAKSVLFNRPDPTAPVSPLFLMGRQQDIAFERQVGNSARRRHHARFWLARGIEHEGRPVWIGDATFDRSAGLSHRNLRPTHHIASNVDQERDTLVSDLRRAGQIITEFEATGMGPRVDAHNAEGDRYDTDGEMDVAIVPAGNGRVTVSRTLTPPFAVAIKDRVWSWITSRDIRRRVAPATRQ